MITIALHILFGYVIWLLSFIISYLLTETKYRLSQFKVFDFKPFNCRTCESFWQGILISILMYFAISPITGITIAIMTGLATIALKINEYKNDEVQL